MNFFPRSDLKIYKLSYNPFGTWFSKNKPHRENQREKLNNICENQLDLQTPGNTSLAKTLVFPEITLNF